MSDLVGNHIVGFLMMGLMFVLPGKEWIRRDVS